MERRLETEARKDWDIISEKIENLRGEQHLSTTRKYLIKDAEACMNNFKATYGILYDPLNPPTQREIDNDDMGGIYF